MHHALSALHIICSERIACKVQLSQVQAGAVHVEYIACTMLCLGVTCV